MKFCPFSSIAPADHEGAVMTAPESNIRVMGLPADPLCENRSRLPDAVPAVRVPQINVVSPGLSVVEFHVAGVMAVCPLQADPPLNVPAACATYRVAANVGTAKRRIANPRMVRNFIIGSR